MTFKKIWIYARIFVASVILLVGALVPVFQIYQYLRTGVWEPLPLSLFGHLNSQYIGLNHIVNQFLDFTNIGFLIMLFAVVWFYELATEK